MGYMGFKYPKPHSIYLRGTIGLGFAWSRIFRYSLLPGKKSPPPSPRHLVPLHLRGGLIFGWVGAMVQGLLEGGHGMLMGSRTVRDCNPKPQLRNPKP